MIPIKDYPGPRRLFPWVMLAILVVNVLVFIFELGYGSASDLDALFSSAGVVPIEYTRGASVGAPPPLGITWTTLVTSMFLHGSLIHVASNMLFLFIFGDNVEDQLGHLRFFLFYMLCGVAAGLTHIFVNANSDVPSIGASGAIAGVLAAYLRMFPSAQVRTLLILGPFITVPRISAGFLIVFWFLTQFVAGVTSLGARTEQTSGIAVWAHVGGFIVGLLLVHLMRPRALTAPASA